MLKIGVYRQNCGYKKPFRHPEGNFLKLPLALAGSLSLFLTLYAGLFVVLAFTDFLENAAAGALPLEPFERTFQGLIFADTNLRHSLSLPSLINALPAAGQTDGRQNRKSIIQRFGKFVNHLSKFLSQAIWSAICLPPSTWK